MSNPELPPVALLLAAFDEQLRGESALSTIAGVQVEVEDNLVRAVNPHAPGMVIATDLDKGDSSTWDLLIGRQVQLFTSLQQPFEWKTWSHDHPQEFLRRLEHFDFVPGETETVMIARVANVDRDRPPPTGVHLRSVTSEEDFARLAALLTEIWEQDMRELAEGCRATVQAFPDAVTVLAAEVGTQWVSSARAEFIEGTEFCTLWGGSTLPAWRGRGIYSSLVSRRARLAADRNFKLLEVDALPSSRPILEQLGFVAVTTTTPFLWSPRTASRRSEA